MARTKGASPGSKPAKSSDKSSPKKSKGQDTEAAFFTFLEDKKKRIPGISLAGAMNAWKALPKIEQESYKLRSKQQKNASHDGTDSSQEQRVYKMLVDGDGGGEGEGEGDGVGSGVGSSPPMAIEHEAISEMPAEPMDVSAAVAETTASTTTITETTIRDASTTTVTSTATVIITEQPSTVIPAEALPAVTIQEQVQEQQGPVIVEDYFPAATSEPLPAPVPSPDLQVQQQAQQGVLPPPIPPLSALQEDEGYVMVESGGDSITSAPIVPCNDVVVCTAQDIEKGPGFEAPAKEAPPAVIVGQISATEPETPAAPVSHADADAPGPVDAGAANDAVAPETPDTSKLQE